MLGRDGFSQERERCRRRLSSSLSHSQDQGARGTEPAFADDKIQRGGEACEAPDSRGERESFRERNEHGDYPGRRLQRLPFDEATCRQRCPSLRQRRTSAGWVGHSRRNSFEESFERGATRLLGTKRGQDSAASDAWDDQSLPEGNAASCISRGSVKRDEGLHGRSRAPCMEWRSGASEGTEAADRPGASWRNLQSDRMGVLTRRGNGGAGHQRDGSPSGGRADDAKSSTPRGIPEKTDQGGKGRGSSRRGSQEEECLKRFRGSPDVPDKFETQPTCQRRVFQSSKRVCTAIQQSNGDRGGYETGNSSEPSGEGVCAEKHAVRRWWAARARRGFGSGSLPQKEACLTPERSESAIGRGGNDKEQRSAGKRSQGTSRETSESGREQRAARFIRGRESGSASSALDSPRCEAQLEGSPRAGAGRGGGNPAAPSPLTDERRGGSRRGTNGHDVICERSAMEPWLERASRRDIEVSQSEMRRSHRDNGDRRGRGEERLPMERGATRSDEPPGDVSFSSTHFGDPGSWPRVAVQCSGNASRRSPRAAVASKCTAALETHRALPSRSPQVSPDRSRNHSRLARPGEQLEGRRRLLHRESESPGICDDDEWLSEDGSVEGHHSRKEPSSPREGRGGLGRRRRLGTRPVRSQSAERSERENSEGSFSPPKRKSVFTTTAPPVETAEKDVVSESSTDAPEAASAPGLTAYHLKTYEKAFGISFGEFAFISLGPSDASKPVLRAAGTMPCSSRLVTAPFLHKRRAFRGCQLRLSSSLPPLSRHRCPSFWAALHGGRTCHHETNCGCSHAHGAACVYRPDERQMGVLPFPLMKRAHNEENRRFTDHLS